MPKEIISTKEKLINLIEQNKKDQELILSILQKTDQEVNETNKQLKLEEIKSLIKKAIPDAEISIQDLAGDDNHYSATIKSKTFSGKSKVEQHKLVYKALKGKMGNELHALALNTLER